jgi:molybdopterin synthase sulfur carrier subunit
MNIKLACGPDILSLRWPEANPPTVAQLLNHVRQKHPRQAAAWCDKQGRLRESLPVFLNGEHVRFRQGLATVLTEGDEVYVIPLIAGG